MGVKIKNLDVVVSAFDVFKERVEQNRQSGVIAAARAYRADVQAVCPVDTGDYRDSIEVVWSNEGNRFVCAVRTNRPQAKRLEFGFWDKYDILGRHFFQRAQPHWYNTLDINRDRYRDMIIEGLFK